MERIDDVGGILRRIQQHGWLPGIQRWKYNAVDDEATLLKAIEAIGQYRNPKFTIDTDNTITYKNYMKWVHGDPTMQCLHPKTKQVIAADLNKGIYIAGQTGSGKSWAQEIMSNYARAQNIKSTIGNEEKCLFWKNFRTDTICDEFSKTGSIDKYKNMTLLGIQDLGAEPSESMYMGNRVNVMQQVLEYRGDFTDKLTFITSNLPMAHESLVQKYGDRVASRLNEMCNYFEIRGKDRRQI